MERKLGLKFLLCILLFILTANSIPLFAATAYFRLFDSSLGVDLESKVYVSHGEDIEWKSGSASNPTTGDKYFYNNQMLFSTVVDGISSGRGLVFTVEAVSGFWEYVLYDAGMKYSRPFGLDVVVRGERVGTSTHDTIDFFRLGLQANSTNNSLTATNLIPASTAQQFSTIWLDAILVIDPFMDDAGQTTIGGSSYRAKSSENPYTATIRVSMYEADSLGNPIGSAIDTFAFEEVGYYKKPTPAPMDISAVLSVSPTTNAVSLDIEAMGNDTSLSQVVADYFFTTSTYVSASDALKNGKFHFYLSSSSDGTSSLGGDKDRFVLRYTKEGRVAAVDTRFNSIEFVAEISGEGGTKAFDGTSRYGSAGDYYSIETDIASSTIYNEIIRWHDLGQIKVRICSLAERSATRPWGVDDLVAGRYTSMVYIHVVSDF